MWLIVASFLGVRPTTYEEDLILYSYSVILNRNQPPPLMLLPSPPRIAVIIAGVLWFVRQEEEGRGRSEGGCCRAAHGCLLEVTLAPLCF